MTVEVDEKCAFTEDNKMIRFYNFNYVKVYFTPDHYEDKTLVPDGVKSSFNVQEGCHGAPAYLIFTLKVKKWYESAVLIPEADLFI